MRRHATSLGLVRLEWATPSSALWARRQGRSRASPRAWSWSSSARRRLVRPRRVRHRGRPGPGAAVAVGQPAHESRVIEGSRSAGGPVQADTNRKARGYHYGDPCGWHLPARARAGVSQEEPHALRVACLVLRGTSEHSCQPHPEAPQRHRALCRSESRLLDLVP